MQTTKWIKRAATVTLIAWLLIGCEQSQLAGGPDAGVASVLPVCGGLPGYSLTMTDCGGRTADGLRCVTGCTWRARSAGAEIQDAAAITVDPGCTTPSDDGGTVLCVFDCLACH